MALRINGQLVDDVQLDQEFDQIKSYYQQQGEASCCDRHDEFRAMARENLIGRTLITQHACRIIPEIPADEIEAEIEVLQKQQGGPEMLCMAYGLSIDQMDVVRADVRTRLQIQKLMQHLLDGEPAPDDRKLREHYMMHLDRFTAPARVHAWHILKSVENGGDRQEIFEELCRVRRRLLEGADFRQLAAQHSDKAIQAAAREGESEDGDGIDLGWFAMHDLVEEFALVAFSMKVGETSPVFATPFGLHLVRLVDRKDAQPLPFAEVRDRVLEDWQQEFQKNRLQELILELTRQARIEEV